HAPRNHAQVIDGGWGADYPSADDFLGKLTCNHFAPRNGLATTDASEFCDPALDNQIARAAALQTTDPSAAAALWARLDHQLTNLAIWLPTVTPNETDLISARIGNYQYNPVWGALLDQLWLRQARPCGTPPARPAAPGATPAADLLWNPRTVPHTHHCWTSTLTLLTHN